MMHCQRNLLGIEYNWAVVDNFHASVRKEVFFVTKQKKGVEK